MSERIDSHHHLWAINDSDYVWMTDAHQVIRRNFLLPEMQAAFAAGGIDGSVVVQARQMLEETHWLLELAERSPQIRGVVGWVPLCEQAGEPHLERFAAYQALKGVRHVVHDEPDDDFILRADFNEGVSRLKTYGLLYDILIFWKHLPQTIRFVDRHPEQAFVVDHIAKPRIAKAGFDQEWAAGIRELAKRPQVSIKVSGMLTEVRDAQWDLKLLQPYFDTVFEAFGPERVMYGSDWPVLLLREPYDVWARTAEQLSAVLSDDEKAAFWGGNAARIYGL
ncbi:MAG TPA: amidohydrolase family protein [Luteolibacter sp.]|nr:amidohydrolase family protein [Luteolibacter sp.]